MKTTLSVYECGEFHNLGKSFIGIESVEEAGIFLPSFA